MPWLRYSIYLFLTLFLPLGLYGQEQSLGFYSVGDVPNVQLQDSTRFVSDPADYIPAEEEAAINRAVLALRQRTQVEFALVVVPNTGGRDIEGFALELFRTWGLGSKQYNNGLLFVLAIEDRKSRFEVGYGLEGYLTDVKASQIWRKVMREEVRRGQYGVALLRAVQAVEQTLEAEGYERGKPAQAHSGIDWDFVVGLYLMASFFVFALSYLNLRTKASQRLNSPHDARRIERQVERDYRRANKLLLLLCFPLAGVLYLLSRSWRGRLQALAKQCVVCGQSTMLRSTAVQLAPLAKREQDLDIADYHGYTCSHCGGQDLIREPNSLVASNYRPCPHCGGHTARLVHSARYRNAQRAILRRDTYLCVYCRQEHTREEEEEDNDNDLMLGGIILGSMLGRNGRGSWGGGGFGGGSWGGGSSGGGGSTGSW